MRLEGVGWDEVGQGGEDCVEGEEGEGGGWAVCVCLWRCVVGVG